MPQVFINVVPSRALSMLVGFLLALAGSLPAAADEDEEKPHLHEEQQARGEMTPLSRKEAADFLGIQLGP